jgi:hypothetical protein
MRITFQSVGEILGKLGRALGATTNRHVGLRDRAAMDVPDIMDGYYDMSRFRRDTLTSAWLTIAKELGANAESLRPTDRLAVELAHRPSWLFEGDDERAFLLTVLDFECRRSGIDFQPARLNTVDDCVRLLYDCMLHRPRVTARKSPSLRDGAN